MSDATTLRGRGLLGMIVLLPLGAAVVVAMTTAASLHFGLSQVLGGEVEQVIQMNLRRVAQEAAAAIDGDALLAAVRENDDGSSLALAKIALCQTREKHQLKEDLYTLHISHGAIVFGARCWEGSILGETYELTPEIKRALKGDSVATPIYQTKLGWWVSHLAPIRNAKGDVTGLVEADYQVDAFIDQTRSRVLRAAAIGFGLALLLVMPLALLFGRKLSVQVIVPLQRLTDAAEKISQGDVDDIDLSRLEATGEVARLAASFERAVVGIRYYVARLRELEESAPDEPPPAASSESAESAESADSTDSAAQEGKRKDSHG